MDGSGLYLSVSLIAVGLLFSYGCMNAKRDLTGCHIVASENARCIQERPDPKPESESRFKVEIKEIELLQYDEPNKLVYAQLQLRMIPTVQSDKKAATVFLGLLSLHDPNKISDAKDTKFLTCKEAPGCIDSKVLLREDHPTIVVGGQGSTGVPVYWSIKYLDTLQRLRLKWEYYQNEHDGEFHCEPV